MKCWCIRGHRKSSQNPGKTHTISFTRNPLPSHKTNKSSHFRLQLSDQCAYKRPFWSIKSAFCEIPSSPNEVCSFHWASANFYDGPLTLRSRLARYCFEHFFLEQWSYPLLFMWPDVMCSRRSELLLFFEKCFLAHTLVLRRFRDFVLFFFFKLFGSTELFSLAVIRQPCFQ